MMKWYVIMMRVKKLVPYQQECYGVENSFGKSYTPELSVVITGRFKSPGNYYWEKLEHNPSCHYFHKGRGTIVVNGKEHQAQAGDVFVFWPDDHLCYHDCVDDPWEYTWVKLEGVQAEPQLNVLGLTRENPKSKVEQGSLLIPFLTEILHRFREGGYSVRYPVKAAWEFLICLEDALQKVETVQSGIAESAKSLIEQQFDHFLTVQGVAELLRVDRSTLFRACKSELGLSPKELVEEVRFKRALKLLTNPQLSIKQVALACGISDQCYFSKAFRKRFQLSPGQWRKNHSKK